MKKKIRLLLFVLFSFLSLQTFSQTPPCHGAFINDIWDVLADGTFANKELKDWYLGLSKAEREDVIRAWAKIADTPISNSQHWISKVDKWWRIKGLDFQYNYSISDDVVEVSKLGNIVAEIGTNFFKIKMNNAFGGDIVCPLNKTTTVIGLYHPWEEFKGIWYLTTRLKLFEIGTNPGGINLLSIPNWSWPQNKAWLLEAVNRGDNIRLISDPNVPRTFWEGGIPPGQPGHIGPTITKLEHDLLTGPEVGYIYDSSIPGYRPQ